MNAGSDRIACLNPRCRRTAARSRYPDEDAEIVCGKCWRKMPVHLRNEYAQIKRHSKRMERQFLRRKERNPVAPETIAYIRQSIRKRGHDNWSRIRAYFLAPDKPEGLESFLYEIGLDRQKPTQPKQ